MSLNTRTLFHLVVISLGFTSCESQISPESKLGRGGGTQKTQSGAWNRAIPVRDGADLGTVAFSQCASDEVSRRMRQRRPEQRTLE